MPVSAWVLYWYQPRQAVRFAGVSKVTGDPSRVNSAVSPNSCEENNSRAEHQTPGKLLYINAQPRRPIALKA